MTILVTGAAGFIGFHTALALLGRGEEVVGVDNLNPYYDITLKQDRLNELAGNRRFRFARVDLADREATAAVFAEHPRIETIVHLAAQPGVRYSLENPFAYVEANVLGHLVVLEEARRCKQLRQMVYASSSSVYGESETSPFSTKDRADRPVSLYAASKRMDELMSHAYSHLYGLPGTALRFFTVYGPWGRPDMAVYSFADSILSGKPIRVFNQGKLLRDFTYVDDIVAGILGAIDTTPDPTDGSAPHRIYNLGNNRPESVARLVTVLEEAIGKAAIIRYEPMQAGDVTATCADIEDSRRDLGFNPSTSLEQGIQRFVTWLRKYQGR